MAEALDAPSLAADAEFRLYEIYRARVVAEDHLVNTRLTWIVLLQAPLFAVVAGLFLDAILLHQQKPI